MAWWKRWLHDGMHHRLAVISTSSPVPAAMARINGKSLLSYRMIALAPSACHLAAISRLVTPPNMETTSSVPGCRFWTMAPRYGVLTVTTRTPISWSQSSRACSSLRP